MLDSSRIRSKKLKRLWTRADEKGIRPDWLPRVKRILSGLNVLVSPDEMMMPPYGGHKLKGDRSDTYSIIVSKNWRITFKWDQDGPFDVDLEDYHGK